MDFNKISQLLNEINDITQNIRKKKTVISTSSDSVDFRQGISKLIENGKSKINQGKSLFQQNYDRVDKPKVTKLTKQFNDLVKEFEVESTSIIDLQLKNAIGTGGRSGSLSINNRDDSSRSGSFAGRVQILSPPPQQQKQQYTTQSHIQLENLEITLSNAEPVEELIINEYNAEVKNLVTELTAIRDIAKDLEVITAEQREGLNAANTNIEVGKMDVEVGNQQLSQAYKYNTSRRKKIIILIILILIVIGLVVGLCVGLLKK
ncbi:hypothetical protein CYY_009524 [Polysphondylium violaceum]|uniref:t-SNARE coiled-coil homology domain-containing protein n=1 Tax=Polysphondylium violaceum TaxID=133409 RepID=A0A8J4PLM8_9MYCE|nr:hypothetical protein CYY_009524 [Polysphondylium violaceum]